MIISRRALPLLFLPRAAAPEGFRVRGAMGGRVAVSHRAYPGAVFLPAPAARLLAIAPFQQGEAALVAFAGPSCGRSACELLAVIGPDGDGLRVLGLEPLEWTGPDGAHLSTRPRRIAAGGGLLLSRAAAAPGPGWLIWRREIWTDRLLEVPGHPLRDAPIHAPSEGSWQDMIAQRRRAIRARLEAPAASIDEALLDLAARSPIDEPR